jgi:6-pyruvoyltetrahydropterin/6-carboxytetrahydropterin synthase
LKSKIHLEYRDHFDAAHYLRNYLGPCSNLHGHRWEVEISLSGMTLDRVGILVDFKVLKAMMSELLPDHCCLNDLPYFTEKNPTAENLSVYLFEKVEEYLKTITTPASVQLERIRVWEAPGACAMVERGPNG